MVLTLKMIPTKLFFRSPWWHHQRVTKCWKSTCKSKCSPCLQIPFHISAYLHLGPWSEPLNCNTHHSQVKASHQALPLCPLLFATNYEALYAITLPIACAMGIPDFLVHYTTLHHTRLWIVATPSSHELLTIIFDPVLSGIKWRPLSPSNKWTHWKAQQDACWYINHPCVAQSQRLGCSTQSFLAILGTLTLPVTFRFTFYLVESQVGLCAYSFPPESAALSTNYTTSLHKLM